MAKPDDHEAPKNIADSAQPVPSPHSPELRGSASAASLPLAALDGHSVAVQVAVAGREQILVGHGEYGQDSEHGKTLRITVTGDSDLEIILAESEWKGSILPGGQHGCDYMVCLNEESPVRRARSSRTALE
jgi:hypothetical protein